MIDGVSGHFTAIDEGCAADDAARLADAGYHSERGLEALAADGMDGYIADGNMRKRDPRHADASVRISVHRDRSFR